MNIYQADLVPVIYPIATADIFLSVYLSCFSRGDDVFAYDLDVDFGMDSGSIRILFDDGGEYGSYGILPLDDIGRIVDIATQNAVTDFVAANAGADRM